MPRTHPREQIGDETSLTTGRTRDSCHRHRAGLLGEARPGARDTRRNHGRDDIGKLEHRFCWRAESQLSGSAGRTARRPDAKTASTSAGACASGDALWRRRGAKNELAWLSSASTVRRQAAILPRPAPRPVGRELRPARAQQRISELSTRRAFARSAGRCAFPRRAYAHRTVRHPDLPGPRATPPPRSPTSAPIARAAGSVGDHRFGDRARHPHTNDVARPAPGPAARRGDRCAPSAPSRPIPLRTTQSRARPKLPTLAKSDRPRACRISDGLRAADRERQRSRREAMRVTARSHFTAASRTRAVATKGTVGSTHLRRKYG